MTTTFMQKYFDGLKANFTPGMFASLAARTGRILDRLRDSERAALIVNSPFSLFDAIESAVGDESPPRPRGRHARDDGTNPFDALPGWRDWINSPTTPTRRDDSGEGLRERIDAAKRDLAQATRDQIASLKSFIAESRANAGKPFGSGRDLRPWFDGRIPKPTDPPFSPSLFGVAIHEAGHACACFAMDKRIVDAIARSDGSGVVQVNPGKMTWEQNIICTAAADEAVSTLSPSDWKPYHRISDEQQIDGMASQRKVVDGVTFREENDRPMTAADPKISQLRDEARSMMRLYSRGVLACAQMLYDNVDRRVDGDDLALVFAFHEFDEFAEDREDLRRYHTGEHWRGVPRFANVEK